MAAKKRERATPKAAPKKKAPAKARAKAAKPAKGRSAAGKAFRPATLAQVRRAFDEAGFSPPHAELDALSKPLSLAAGGVTLDELRDVKGTVVVTGDLRVKGDVALKRGRGIPTLVVTGDLFARHVYADGFLVVGGTLAALTVVGDSGWDGGLFVGGLDADTAVLKDTALETIGRGAKSRVRVRRLADLEKPAKAKKAVPELFELDPDDVPAYAWFLTLPR